jgi:hypothetical protein
MQVKIMCGTDSDLSVLTMLSVSMRVDQAPFAFNGTIIGATVKYTSALATQAVADPD